MIALIAVGAISMLAYVVHARRTPAPVLDLSLFGLPTFRASVLGGFVCSASASARCRSCCRCCCSSAST